MRNASQRLRFRLFVLVGGIALALGTARAVDQAPSLNPAAISIQLPANIHWTDEASGARIAKVLGDPDKPGLYVVFYEWTAHHMSRPHWHAYDRYVTVLSGTWWVGTGTKFEPDKTVPLPTGSFVTHFAKQVHYDGAKDADVVLEIIGQGPATSTPAETP